MLLALNAVLVNSEAFAFAILKNKRTKLQLLA